MPLPPFPRGKSCTSAWPVLAGTPPVCTLFLSRLPCPSPPHLDLLVFSYLCSGISLFLLPGMLACSSHDCLSFELQLRPAISAPEASWNSLSLLLLGTSRSACAYLNEHALLCGTLVCLSTEQKKCAPSSFRWNAWRPWPCLNLICIVSIYHIVVLEAE